MRLLAVHVSRKTLDTKVDGHGQRSRTSENERGRWKIARLEVFYPSSRSSNKTCNYGNVHRYSTSKMCVCVGCAVSHRPFRLSEFFFVRIYAGTRVFAVRFSSGSRLVGQKWTSNAVKRRLKNETFCDGHWQWLNENHTRWWTGQHIQRTHPHPTNDQNLSAHNHWQTQSRMAKRVSVSEIWSAARALASLVFVSFVAQKENQLFAAWLFSFLRRVCFYFVFESRFSLFPWFIRAHICPHYDVHICNKLVCISATGRKSGICKTEMAHFLVWVGACNVNM